VQLLRTSRVAFAALAALVLAIGVAGVPAMTKAGALTARPQLPSQWSECMDAEQRSSVKQHAAQYAFVFTRGAYSSWSRRGWGRGGGSWSTDWPKSDCQFNVVFRRLTNLHAYPAENAVTLDDPNLRRFPFLYMLEVGRMSLQPEEVKGLRDYVMAGGFVMFDDFWGTQEWENFEEQMRIVFPEYPIEDIPLDHQLFHSFYDIDEILQVPNINNGCGGWGTSERDGYVPQVRGIFNEKRRLMAVINWNTDLGDAWEWAEQACYPVKYSHYAFQVGVNTIIYAMSH
jgi:hypothetical protein